MDDLELLVNGTNYFGWTSLGVTRAVDASSGAFTVTLTERWEGQDGMAAQEEPWPILPGDRCEVRLGGIPMVIGYIDIFKPSFSANDHTINIQGRDRTADLIDCSAVHTPDEWKNIDLFRFAQILAKPFGVGVSADVPVGEVFSVCKLQQGETAFEAIERYARQRRLSLMPDGAGGLLITRAGNKRASVGLVQGENILSASGSIDHSQRFRNYLVKGQAAYDPTSEGETEAHIEGGASDSGIRRYRPLLVVAESGSSSGSAQERATWEANSRLGKSASASITVQGWRQTPGGPLWEPGMLVQVKSPWLRMDGQMIIRQATYERGEGGTTTKLDIVSPQAFSPEPPDSNKGVKGKAGKKGGRNIWAEAIGEEDRKDG
ncbi:phage baseplate assembly protein [Pseudomonas sp. SDO5591_S426]